MVITRQLSDHLTSEGLADYAEQCSVMDTVYLWGGLGEMITNSVISHVAQLYPAKYDVRTVDRFRGLVGASVLGFDCSGLLKRYVMGGLDGFRYEPAMDLSCAGLLHRSPNKGPIDSLPEMRGICLYMKGHTGIYIGDGSVIEATPNRRFGNGVVRTKLSDRHWEQWYQMPWVDYESSCDSQSLRAIR